MAVESAKPPPQPSEAEKAAMDKLAQGILPEIEYGDLEFYECLSTGTYGAVYRSQWKSQEKIVAVKRLLVLEKEAHVLSVLRHKNIIQFYGAVTKAPNFCIITEFADKGSLFSHLANSENADLTFSQIVSWSIDIASGVNYLHNEAPVKIVHRDLKSKNVVVSFNDVCKLCDFGTSKAVVHSAPGLMSVVGTVPWMSPEMIQSLPVSERTDTWSYAVVLWELCTREIPFKNLDAFRIAWMVVEEQVRLPVPSSCPEKFADLMRKCWITEAKERPDFREILRILQEIETDVDFTSQAVDYYNKKAESKIEIEQQIEILMLKERELSVKERNLTEWENRLRRREQNIEMERTRRSTEQVSLPFDLDDWDEEDVIVWLLQLPAGCDDYERLNCLACAFRQNQINGRRLAMLTENDLLHLGVDSIQGRQRLLSEIGRLVIENQNQLDFPSLAYSAATAPRSRSGSLADRRVDLTLLFAVYIRKGPTLGTHKWKLLMDYDDDSGFDDIDSLIDEVRYIFQEEPHVYKVNRTPFIMREWAVGFSRETTEIQCVVTFSNLVRKPRNTKLNFSFDYDQRGILFEKPVELYVKLGPEVTNRAHRVNSNSSATSKTPLMSPLPNLQGAWLEKALENSVHIRAPLKLDKSDDQISSWASVVAGSTPITSQKLLVKRLISEEIRRTMSSAGSASYFVEGALSFDDEPSFPKNDNRQPHQHHHRQHDCHNNNEDEVAPFRRRADSGFVEQQASAFRRRRNTDDVVAVRRHHFLNQERRFRNSCSDFQDTNDRPTTRRAVSDNIDEQQVVAVGDSPTARRDTGSTTSDYHSHSSSLSPMVNGEVLWPKKSTPTTKEKNRNNDELDINSPYVQRHRKPKMLARHIFDEKIAETNSQNEDQSASDDRESLEVRRRSYVDVASSTRKPLVKSLTVPGGDPSRVRKKSNSNLSVVVHGGYSKWKWKG